MQPRRNAGGQAHRTEGGHHLEQDIHHVFLPAAPVFDGADDDGIHDHQAQGEGGQGQGPLDQPFRQTAVVVIVILPLPDGGDNREHHHEKGGGLNAAAGGRGGRADEHQDDTHQLHGGSKIPLSQGVEAGGPKRHRLERGGENLPPGADVRLGQGAGIVPLEQRREDKAGEEQPQGHQQHHAAVQHQLAEPAVAQHVHNHREAHAAQGDEGHDHQIDYRVGHIVLDGVLKAEGVKARVAEAGDGQEHRVKNPLPHSIFRDEPGAENQGRNPLHREGNRHGVAHQAHHALQGIGIEGLLNQKPLLQGDPLAHHHKEDGGDGHKAQAADLYQREDDQLAEQGEHQPGVHHRQAGHADRGGGGEQRVHKGDVPSFTVAKGMHSRPAPIKTTDKNPSVRI